MNKLFIVFVCVIAALPSGDTASAQPVPLKLTVTWADNSTNEDGFGIERKTGTTGTYTEVGRVGVNVATFTDHNLPFATQFCYRLYAYNAKGKSGYSPEGCGTAIINPTPAAPSGLTVTPLP